MGTPSASAPRTGRIIPDEAGLPVGCIDGVQQRRVGFDRREIRNDFYCVAGSVLGSDATAPGAVSQLLLYRVPDAAERRQMIRRMRALAVAGGMAMR